MSDTKNVKGLVLGGGGARGCYEIGAWQAFDTAGEHFDCVAGTSIGAIVAAIYVQQTLEPLVDFVDVMKPTMVVKDLFNFPENFTELVENRHKMLEFIARYINTGVDITPLKEAFSVMFHYDLFKESPINFACWTFNVSKMSGQAFFKKDMNAENAENIILASASCFPAFPMMEIGDQKYIDGGYENNVPADLAVEMGATDLTIIDVHGPGRVKPLPEGITSLYIQPLLPLGNFLDFSRTQTVQAMHIGYLETMKYLSRYCGYIYTFGKEEWSTIFVFERYVRMLLERSNLHITRQEGLRVLQVALGYRPPVLMNAWQSEYDTGLVVEAMAYLLKVDPVELYEYRDFLGITADALIQQARNTSLVSARTYKDIRDAIKTGPALETMLVLYRNLMENKGHLPLYAEPLARVADSSYIMAMVGCCMTMYLNKKL